MQDAPVKGEDVKQIEMLTLVLVEPLDLHIEQGRGVDRECRREVWMIVGQMDFVGMLHRHELELERGIIGPLFKLAEFIEVLLIQGSRQFSR